MPFGIDTPTLFAMVFGVLGPVKLATGDPVLAWKVAMAVAAPWPAPTAPWGPWRCWQRRGRGRDKIEDGGAANEHRQHPRHQR
jgi:hypothetical protein